MTENMEQLVQSCTSIISDTREVVKEHSDLHGASQDSMPAPLIVPLVGRFQEESERQSYQAGRLGVPATLIDMDDHFQHCSLCRSFLET